ncbi:MULTISPECIES: transposase [Dysgonomonas]|uniref:transposase n=1 Tax=Dysgonomonas TaxID=156973 RepID=UPI001ACC81B0|nr:MULTISPECIES: transposase [Dysgonomonas]MBN9300621.1 transposase [Dysgonomonas mossii]
MRKVQKNINTGNSCNGSYPKKIQGKDGVSVIEVPRGRQSDFEPVAVPKHQRHDLYIKHLVISLYAKSMSA